MNRTVTIPLEEHDRLRAAEETLAQHLQAARQAARDKAFGEYIQTQGLKHRQEVAELQQTIDKLRNEVAALEGFKAYAYWAFDAVCLLRGALRNVYWQGGASKRILKRIPPKSDSAKIGERKALERSEYRWSYPHE